MSNVVLLTGTPVLSLKTPWSFITAPDHRQGTNIRRLCLFFSDQGGLECAWLCLCWFFCMEPEASWLYENSGVPCCRQVRPVDGSVHGAAFCFWVVGGVPQINLVLVFFVCSPFSHPGK